MTNSEILLSLLSLKRLVQRNCTEIGLQRYDRKPHEMLETPDWWKLRQAEKITRATETAVSSQLGLIITALEKEELAR